MSRTLVNRATTDDQKPVSGLILKELADKTLESIIECQNIQTMLLSKLAKPSPDVKLKVLTCIKYLAQNGRDDFRIEFQRNHGKIREHTTIRGVADPLRGELPFDKVREMAKEAMNAIFNSTGRVQEKSTGSRMTGYGGDGQSFDSSSSSSSSKHMSSMSSERADNKPQHDYGSGTFSSGSVGQTGKQMQGYGNYDPTKDKSFLEKMKEKVVKEQPPGPYKPYVKPTVYGEGTYNNYGGGVDIAPVTSDATRKKGGVGGDWGKEDGGSGRISAPSSNSFGAAAQQKSFGAAHNTTVASQNHSVARNKNVQPTEFERKIIEDVTAPTGVRVTLSGPEMAGFLRKCEALDTYMVVGLLNEKLVDPNPASQQKALHCLESLLSTERFAEDTEEFLSDHEDTIASLLDNPNKAIRTKALKIMVQIGLRDESEGQQPQQQQQSTYQPQQQQQQQQQQRGDVDLLNLNGVETVTKSLDSFNLMDPTPVQSFDLVSEPTPAPSRVDPFTFTSSEQPPANPLPFDFKSGGTQPAATKNDSFSFLPAAPVSQSANFNFMQSQPSNTTSTASTLPAASPLDIFSQPSVTMHVNKPANDFNLLSSLPQNGTTSQPATLHDPLAELLGSKSSIPQFKVTPQQQQQQQFLPQQQQQFFPQQQQQFFPQQQQQFFPQQQQQFFPQQQQQFFPQQQQQFQQQQQMRNFSQLQPLQPNRAVDSFFGVGLAQQPQTQKAAPRADSFAFVKEEMSRN